MSQIAFALLLAAWLIQASLESARGYHVTTFPDCFNRHFVLDIWKVKGHFAMGSLRIFFYYSKAMISSISHIVTKHKAGGAAQGWTLWPPATFAHKVCYKEPLGQNKKEMLPSEHIIE